MYYGVVLGSLEPSLTLAILSPDGTDVEIDFAIDTGFTEEMTLPPDIIDELNLPTSCPKIWHNTLPTEVGLTVPLRHFLVHRLDPH